MSSESSKVLSEALSLPESDRAKIAASLIESLEEKFDPRAEDAWRVEVARRVRELDAGTVKTIDWVKARRMILDQLDD